MTAANPPWLIRAATPDDVVLLEHFVCAVGLAPWEVEVQRFVRVHLLQQWAFDPHAADNDPRALVVIERTTGGVEGVAAHSAQS